MLLDIDDQDWKPPVNPWWGDASFLVWATSPQEKSLKSLKRLALSKHAAITWFIASITEEEIEVLA